ncbi:menaquinone biosynthetic enzyme MqnA/MqnD family protein [Nocardia salmonicida]|uniref:menaquinone biosynthetic enzyme MqnA/MqnD family protein n=1 Tax=Nocardia salmonicida TaxID=53431 RepID=UPI002E2A3050|nr:menaquinone biosynthesis protein [Nocardia salmonicida]
MTESILSPLRIRQARPRVGHISYLNCAPLLWGLARTGKLMDIDLVKGTPDVLGYEILEGRLDISPVSLSEFLQHREFLVPLSEIAIGSDGPVMSCVIVSKVPLEELNGARVALGSESRTSIRLAQLVLGEMVGVRAEYFNCKPDLESMLDSASAAVLIGDAALRAATLAPVRSGLTVHDLGQIWREWTGHPFVFAVIAARREFAAQAPDLVSEVHRALVEARDLALSEIDEVSQRIARWEDFDAELLRRYYTRALKYDLGDRQYAGIAEFASRIGLPSNLDDRVPLDLSWSI